MSRPHLKPQVPAHVRRLVELERKPNKTPAEWQEEAALRQRRIMEHLRIK